MVVANFVDGCVFLAAAPGTGAFVVGSPAAGWRTPAQAGALNGGVYRYRAYNFDQSQWEIGTGTYTASTETLTRDIVLASAMLVPTDKMDFATLPTVALTVQAQDFTPVSPADFVQKVGDTMTGPLLLPNGTGPNVALGFSAEVNSGLYRASAGIVRMVMGGTTVQEYQTTNRGTLFYGKATMVAGNVTRAPINFPHGVAPTTPVDGDLWTTTAGFFGRINGVTVQLATLVQLGQYLALTGGTLSGNLTVGATGTMIKVDIPTGSPSLQAVTANNGVASVVLTNSVASWQWKVDAAGDFTAVQGVTERFKIVGTNGSVGVYGDVYSTKVSPQINLNRTAVAQDGILYGKLNSVARWAVVMGDQTAETGSNSGSNWWLGRYSDAGSYLGQVLNFDRATGIGSLAATPTFPTATPGDNSTKGATTGFVAAALAVIDALYLKLTGGKLTGDLEIEKANPQFIIDKAASGQSAAILGHKGGVRRWSFVLGNGTAEGGSNAGSDLSVDAYDDAGTYLYSPLTIFRNTGQMFFSLGFISNGNANINKASPNLLLNKPASGSSASVFGNMNNLSRWQLVLGDNAAESSGNAGSDFVLHRYNDAGTFLDTVLKIVRATAAVSGTIIATAAQYWANTAGKLLTTDGLWASAVPVVVPYAASVTLNFANGINFSIESITGAITIANPTGGKAGMSGYVRLSGSGMSGAAITWGSNWHFPTGTKPTTMGANTHDIIWYTFAADGNSPFCNYVKTYTNA
jgi:hypothetical protein